MENQNSLATHMSMHEMRFNVLLKHWENSGHHFLMRSWSSTLLQISLDSRNKVGMNTSNLQKNIRGRYLDVS